MKYALFIIFQYIKELSFLFMLFNFHFIMNFILFFLMNVNSHHLILIIFHSNKLLFFRILNIYLYFKINFNYYK